MDYITPTQLRILHNCTPTNTLTNATHQFPHWRSTNAPPTAIASSPFYKCVYWEGYYK